MTRASFPCRLPSAFCLATLSLVVAPVVHAQQNCALGRASIESAGTQTTDGSMHSMAFSANGRHVAWTTSASTLVAGDVNSGYDVFVHDNATGVTELASVDSTGAQHPIGWSGIDGIDITPDGRFVVFTSGAMLDPLDISDRLDIYRRDRLTGQTTLVSRSVSGTGGNSNSTWPSISADGQFVVFSSRATNLVANDTNDDVDVFVRDMQTAAVTRVTLTTAGLEAQIPQQHSFMDNNLMNFFTSMSDDGRVVAFVSRMQGLAPTDPPGDEVLDVFVHDRLTGVTREASLSTAGSSVPGAADRPSLSANGRRVAFEAQGEFGFGHLTTGVYLRDLSTGTLELVNRSAIGLPSFEGRRPALSADSFHVAFDSHAFDLVQGDVDNVNDVFVRNMTSGTTVRVSDAGASGSSGAYAAAISSDGRSVAFRSFDSQSISADTNGLEDVFVRACDSASTTFCVGTAAACPCGQAGAPGGCTHSGSTGGLLTVAGSATISFDTARLVGTNMPDGPCMYVQGSLVGTGAQLPFGDGLLCLAGSIVRLGVEHNQGGASQFPPSPQALSVVGGVANAGGREYQLWYRDALPFCTGSTFNFTNAVGVAWIP